MTVARLWLVVALCLWPVFSAAQDIQAVQRALNTLGFAVGEPDGQLGQRSRTGIEAFQYAYGFRVSGTLTVRQTETLIDLARIVRRQSGPRQRGPLRPDAAVQRHVVEMEYPQIFANGAHYAFAHMWRYQGPSADTDMTRHERVLSAQQRLMNRALKEAAENGRAYPRALATLAVAGRIQAEDLPIPISEAIEVLVSRALRDGAEPQVINTAFWAFRTRGLPFNCLEHPEGPQIRAQAERMFELSASHPSGHGPHHVAASCGSPEDALAIKTAWTAIARNRDPIVLAAALKDEALAAYQMGRPRHARPLLAEFHTILADSQPAEYQIDFNGRVIGDIQTIRIMRSIGLRKEARDAAEIYVRNVTGPDSGLPQNQIGDATIWGETYFEEARDIAGVLIYTARPRTIRKFSRYLDRESDWFALSAGVPDMLIDEKNAELLHAAGRLTPWFLQQDLPEQAAVLSVGGARAALNMGDFAAAEHWVDAAITHAAATGHNRFDRQIEEILSRLSLSAAEARSPGTVLGEAIIFYLEARCLTDPDPNIVGPYRPLVDHYGLTFDPDMLRDLRATGVRDVIRACREVPNRYSDFDRLWCHLSARDGDLAAVNAALEKVIAPGSNNKPQFQLPECVAGLADAGRRDLLAPYSTRLASLDDAEVLWLSSLPPDRQPSAINQVLANYSPPTDGGWDPRIIPQLAAMSRDERTQIQDRFRGVFLVLYAGANLRGYEEAEFFNRALNDATASLSYGLPDLAEAYLAVDTRILPAELPVTDREEVSRILGDATRLRLVEAHARVAIARGQPDHARAILSPFAEAMLSGLDDGSIALQGRIEQVARSGASLLSLWIGLQVDGPGNTETIFRAQQALALAGSQASLSAIDARIASADPDLSRAYQDARRRLRALRADPDIGPDAIAAASAELAEREAALSEIEALETDVALASVLPPETAQQRLAAGDAGLLVATQLPEMLILSWVDAAGLQQKSLPMSAENLSARVTAFRQGITDSGRDDNRFNQAEARALYSDLFNWIDGPLPERIFLVLDDPLTSLPLAALRSPDDQWLGAAHRLRIVPSVGWIDSGGDARPAGSAPFLGIGAAEFAAPELPPLPETEAELRFLAAALGADPGGSVHVGAAANPTTLADLNADGTLAEAAVVSFATHGLLGSGIVASAPGEASLALSADATGDAYLTSREVFDLRLNARLVILSACNTGTPGAGAGLSELAAGFIYAGAQSLMVSHWAVDSAATVEVMKNIALGTAADATAPADAILRDTIRTLSSPGSPWDHPRYWAAFFIVG